jgi:hypothetical protein
MAQRTNTIAQIATTDRTQVMITAAIGQVNCRSGWLLGKSHLPQ